jgi:hypothetical protein
MPTLKVLLDPEEQEALITLAKRLRRDPRVQAAIIIRRALERHGLLAPAPLLSAADQEKPDVHTRP